MIQSQRAVIPTVPPPRQITHIPLSLFSDSIASALILDTEPALRWTVLSKSGSLIASCCVSLRSLFCVFGPIKNLFFGFEGIRSLAVTGFLSFDGVLSLMIVP